MSTVNELLLGKQWIYESKRFFSDNHMSDEQVITLLLSGVVSKFRENEWTEEQFLELAVDFSKDWHKYDEFSDKLDELEELLNSLPKDQLS
jgi:hypothetical protein